MDLETISQIELGRISVEYNREDDPERIFVIFDDIEYYTEKINSNEIEFLKGNEKITFWKNLDGTWDINTNTYFAKWDHVIKCFSKVSEIRSYLEEFPKDED
jgi:hypothetical protein